MKLADHVTSSIGEAAAKSKNVLKLVGRDKLNRVSDGGCGGGLPLNRTPRGKAIFIIREPDCDLS